MEFSVLPAITSTNGEWRQMIEEANILGLRKAGFFPTCLSPIERQEAYRLFEQSCIEEIPFVHLRHDFSLDEIRYLKNVFGTKKFNLHSPFDITFLPMYDLSEFKDEIFIENATWPWKDSIGNWAGICLDVTHFEAETLNNSEVVKDWQAGLDKYQVGIWHIGAIFNPPAYDKTDGNIRYDHHRFDLLKRFNYVRKYFKYLTDTMVLEVENPLGDQMKAKKYIEEMIRGELTAG